MDEQAAQKKEGQTPSLQAPLSWRDAQHQMRRDLKRFGGVEHCCWLPKVSTERRLGIAPRILLGPAPGTIDDKKVHWGYRGGPMMAWRDQARRPKWVRLARFRVSFLQTQAN